jgi:hypothetical protein
LQFIARTLIPDASNIMSETPPMVRRARVLATVSLRYSLESSCTSVLSPGTADGRRVGVFTQVKV